MADPPSTNPQQSLVCLDMCPTQLHFLSHQGMQLAMSEVLCLLSTSVTANPLSHTLSPLIVPSKVSFLIIVGSPLADTPVNKSIGITMLTTLTKPVAKPDFKSDFRLKAFLAFIVLFIVFPFAFVVVLLFSLPFSPERNADAAKRVYLADYAHLDLPDSKHACTSSLSSCPCYVG